MLDHAVILAGGEGTRLRPVTYEMPKSLVPVQGLPIISWQLRWLARHGVRHVLVIIPPKWRSAFERWHQEYPRHLIDRAMGGAPIDVELWVEPEPMGTMGALVHQLHARWPGQSILITNGDELKGFDLNVLRDFHRRQQQRYDRYAVTMALRRVPNPWDYGVADMQGDLIAAFYEKPKNPPSDLVNAGLYVLDTSLLQPAPAAEKFLMLERDLFPRLAVERRLGGCVLDGPWYDCGTIERWEHAIKGWQEPT